MLSSVSLLRGTAILVIALATPLTLSAKGVVPNDCGATEPGPGTCCVAFGETCTLAQTHFGYCYKATGSCNPVGLPCGDGEAE